MKRFLLPLLGLMCMVLMLSCQKEKSIELAPPAKGSLQTSGSNCLEKIRAGVYATGKALTDSNYILAEVHVTRPGPYTIETTRIENGYSFKASGNFTDTGMRFIRLVGKGTPILAQEDIFTIIFDSTSCSFSVTVVPGGTGNNGTCNATVTGDYSIGGALNSSHQVTMQHDFAAAGTYTVATDTKNGYSFRKLVTITTPGPQSITLTGEGTPVAAQTDNFTVNFGDGSSTCGFSVTVGTVTPPPPNSSDYFPMTQNSWWSYNDIANGDTLSRVVSGSKTIGANTYVRFLQKDDLGAVDDSMFYRKSGTDYFEYTDVDFYTSVSFDMPQKGEILFLKQGLATGTTWNSAEFAGTVGGTAAKIRYQFTCTEADAVATIGGKTFNGTHKITMQPQASLGTAPFSNTPETFELYFVRGLGLVYVKATLGGSTFEHIEIRNWQVF